MERTSKYELLQYGSSEWRAKKKHLFVLSAAGKPIWSRYADESNLATLTATLQAIVDSVADNDDDAIHHARAHNLTIVFLVRGSLTFVAVSSCGDAVHYLEQQLSLLHAHILSILTAQVDEVLRKSPSFDMRNLLGGTDRTFRTLVHQASRTPCALLRSVRAVRMPPAARTELGRALLEARAPSLLFALVLMDGALAHALRPRRHHLHAEDVLLVLNLVSASATLREGVSFIPLCLPGYNARGFLYAHVSCIAPAVNLVLVSPSRDAFAELSACSQLIAERAARPLLSSMLADAADAPTPQLDAPAVPEVLHFIYRVDDQLTCADLRSSHSPYAQVQPLKRLLRIYQHAHARVRADCSPTSGKLAREYYQSRDSGAVLLWCTHEWELFVAFSPLVTPQAASAACARLLKWLKREQKSLFVPVINPR